MRYRSVLFAIALLLIPIAAVSLTIPPDVDLLRTPSLGEWDFSGDPIPADFFGPGSDPFDGIIAFVGDPLASSPHAPSGDLGLADTIIERLALIDLPSPTSSAAVPIEMAICQHNVS